MSELLSPATIQGLSIADFPSEPDNGRWELKKLNDRHKAMIELALLGKKHNEIAQEIGSTPQSVHMAMQSPILQAELSRRREQRNRQTDAVSVEKAATASTILAGAAVNAATELVNLVRTGSEKARLTAARDILDRTGHARAETSLMGGATVLKGERMELLIIALRESRQMRTVEATVVETQEVAAQ